MLTGIHTQCKKLINGLTNVIALSLQSDILKDALRKKMLVLEKIISWFLVASTDTVIATPSTALITEKETFDFQHSSQEEFGSLQTTNVFLLSPCTITVEKL